jgi:hypothetical protein
MVSEGVTTHGYLHLYTIQFQSSRNNLGQNRCVCVCVRVRVCVCACVCVRAQNKCLCVRYVGITFCFMKAKEVLHQYRYFTEKLHGLSPRANYTNRVTTACRRS